MQKIIALAAALLVAGAFAGCATTPEKTPTTSTPSTSTPLTSTPVTSTPAAGNNTTAPVTDVWYNATQTPPGPNATYAFDGPTHVNPGWVTFHLANKGLEGHQIVILKLAPGETAASHMGAMGDANTTMEDAHKNATYVGGVGSTNPGDTAATTVHLTPGTYVLECQIPGPAGVHAMHGMTLNLTVAGADNGAHEPVSDLTLTLVDFKFQWSANATAGHHVVKVVNNGTMPHEAPIFQLAANKTIQDFLTWSGTPVGPPPMTHSFGAGGIAPGQVEYVLADFAAGQTYGTACFYPDAQGNPHFTHGMTAQWTVA
jgi:uncharacterized cupredoxin-like copper-binding protein